MTTELEPQTTLEVGGMGHSVKRKEDPRFIQGRGEYIEDVNLPGQLWLDIVRSPYAHARIKSIDATEALKIPGVAAVVTGKDLEGYKLHWMPTLAGDMQMVLPVDTVMYQSQEVAAVIATSRYAAADGVAAVEVDYEPLPVVIDPFKALEADAPVLRPDRGEDKQTNHIWHWESGDAAATDAALANAEVRVVRGHLHPAHPRGLDRDLRLRRRLEPDPPAAHAAHDLPGAARDPDRDRAGGRRAPACPIYEHNIRVKTHDIGGGFGGKVPVYPGYVLAVAASFLTGKPVKWIEDRSENLQADSFARDYHIHAEMGATKDGKIQALKVKTIADHGYTDAAADPSKFPAGLFNVITGSYDFDERVRRGRRRLHQQAAGRRRLPLLVPGDGGRPRHRADGRHPRPRDRQGPGPAADGELHPARAVPVPHAHRLGLRLGRLPGGAPEGDGHDRLRRSSAASRPRSARVASSWASASRASPRSSAPGRRTTSTSSA